MHICGRVSILLLTGNILAKKKFVIIFLKKIRSIGDVFGVNVYFEKTFVL